MISHLIATRKRAAQLERLLDSIEMTFSKTTQIEFLFHLLIGDEASFKVLNKLEGKYKYDYLWNSDEFSLVQLYNQLASKAKGDILAYINDDMVFRTPDWDLEVQKLFLQDKKALVAYGPDGHWNGEIATWAFIKRDWLNIFGWLAPPQYKHFYFDTWITDVSNASHTSAYSPLLLIEHVHYHYKKAEFDETYSKDAGLFFGESKLYRSVWEKGKRERAIESLKKRGDT